MCQLNHLSLEISFSGVFFNCTFNLFNGHMSIHALFLYWVTFGSLCFTKAWSIIFKLSKVYVQSSSQYSLVILLMPMGFAVIFPLSSLFLCQYC